MNDTLSWNRWTTGALYSILAAVGLLVLVSQNSVLHILVGVVLFSACIFFSIKPTHGILLYLIYLPLDGAIKILSSYNPVVHVLSDLLIIVVFLRLVWHGCFKNVVMTNVCRAKINRVTGFLFIFWMSVLLQFFNPFGIGILPSLASLKIYAVPMLTFISVGFYLRNEEVEKIPFLVFLMGLFQIFFSLFDWYSGPGFLGGLHGGYTAIGTFFLKGMPYRPFGTSTLPGGASVLVFHSLLSALLVASIVAKKVAMGKPRLNIWSVLLVLYWPLAILAVVVCQGRMMLIRFLLVALLGYSLRGKKQFLKSISLVVLAVFFIFTFLEKNTEDVKSYKNPLSRLNQAVSRMRTLESLRSWQTARGGTWALDEMGRRGSVTLTGIGLSRVSASSTPWRDRIADNRYFDSSWAFTDNLFLALFTELGVFGLTAYLALMGVILFQFLGKSGYAAKIALVNGLAMIISGYASEGILYQPDASFFWLYAAIGLRLGFRGDQVT